MRSRRGHSRSSDKGCFRRVVIEGLKPPFDKDDSIRTWLARYGTVEGKHGSEIERFYSSIVVKFSSELQAAEAVRSENGIRSSGSNIKVQLADSDTIHQLVQIHSRRKRSLSLQRKRSTSSKSGSSTRPARKLRLKTMGFRHSDVRSQPSKRETSTQESKEATASSKQQQQHHFRSSSEYDVAILAVTHDLVQYAETVQTLLHRHAVEEEGALSDHQEQRQQQEAPELQIRSPRVKIMVLMSMDHIAPCMQDLGEEGVLFAILLNTANMTHNSCTLRILHSSTQQEHRNMPLPDAIDLLLRDFADYLEAEAAFVSVSKATSPLPLPAPPPSTPQQHSKQPRQLQLRQQCQQQMRHRRRRCRHRYRHSSLSSHSSCTSTSPSSLSFRTASSSVTSSSRHLHRSKRRSHQLQQQKQSHSHHRRHHPQRQRLGWEEADTFGTAGMETIPTPDDPNFLAPSRHVAVLLRMLADSRILSVGELDEISAFIAQRRARLTGELITGVNPNAALKARIMETLYPGFRSGGGGHVAPIPSTTLQARRSLPANVASSSTDVIRNTTTAAVAAASGAAVVPTQTPSVGTDSSNWTGDAPHALFVPFMRRHIGDVEFDRDHFLECWRGGYHTGCCIEEVEVLAQRSKYQLPARLANDAGHGSGMLQATNLIA
ncbi:Nuclear receptor coactivator 5 [Taenia solium]|eukprot:TsM_000991000 transcript=TsM_000991000 gene=TsM_000991000